MGSRSARFHPYAAGFTGKRQGQRTVRAPVTPFRTGRSIEKLLLRTGGESVTVMLVTLVALNLRSQRYTRAVPASRFSEKPYYKDRVYPSHRWW